MRLDRVHIALLAVMSIFTGVIAPVIYVEKTPLPLPMTNARELAALMLIILACMFYLGMERKWKLYHLLAASVTILIGWVGLEYILGSLGEIRSGAFASGPAWGWIFLLTGVAGFIVQARNIFRSTSSENQVTILEHMIAILGFLTLLGMSGIIIFISLYGGTQKSELSILEKYYGSGGTIMMTGVHLSPGYREPIEHLHYDRREDILSFVVGLDGSGKTLEHSTGVFSERRYSSIEPVYIHADEMIALAKKGDTSLLIYGNTEKEITEGLLSESSALVHTASGWQLWGEHGNKLIPALDPISLFRITPSGDTLAWVTKDGELSTVLKDNEKILTLSGEITDITLSKNGYNLVTLVRKNGAYSIYKNNTLLALNIPTENFGTYVSNGSNTIFTVKKGSTTKINIDGEELPKEFEEVREIFIEKNGNSYAYFARPVGETKWCLFTRYKGNICGLEGYMNPSLGADGGSILFAGYKDKKWSVYRNTEVLVEDTGYSNSTISRDYFFVDTTSPRKYIFYKYNPSDSTYQIIKNGELLGIKWQDVGLDVSFGFDDRVITSVKYQNEWHILEL